jgi:hypothetical protein
LILQDQLLDNKLFYKYKVYGYKFKVYEL